MPRLTSSRWLLQKSISAFTHPILLSNIAMAATTLRPKNEACRPLFAPTYIEAMPIELPPKAAKTFVKHMRAFHSEPNAIERDKIAGDAAHLLKPYLPPRDRKLRLPDIYEMFEAMKDHA